MLIFRILLIVFCECKIFTIKISILGSCFVIIISIINSRFNVIIILLYLSLSLADVFLLVKSGVETLHNLLD